MDPKALYQLKSDFQILDLREDHKWAAGGIAGAHHIPLGELATRLDEVDRRRPVVTVCRSGNRSGKAARQLNKCGLHAHNLDGGLRAWVAAGLTVTTPHGGPGQVA